MERNLEEMIKSLEEEKRKIENEMSSETDAKIITEMREDLKRIEEEIENGKVQVSLIDLENKKSEIENALKVESDSKVREEMEADILKIEKEIQAKSNKYGLKNKEDNEQDVDVNREDAINKSKELQKTLEILENSKQEILNVLKNETDKKIIAEINNDLIKIEEEIESKTNELNLLISTYKISEIEMQEKLEEKPKSEPKPSPELKPEPKPEPTQKPEESENSIEELTPEEIAATLGEEPYSDIDLDPIAESTEPYSWRKEILKEYLSQEEIENLSEIEMKFAIFDVAFEKSDKIYSRGSLDKLSEEEIKSEYQNYIKESTKETEIFNKKLRRYIKQGKDRLSQLKKGIDDLEIQLIRDNIEEMKEVIEDNNMQIKISKLAVERDILFNFNDYQELNLAVRSGKIQLESEPTQKPEESENSIEKLTPEEQEALDELTAEYEEKLKSKTEQMKAKNEYDWGDLTQDQIDDLWAEGIVPGSQEYRMAYDSFVKMPDYRPEVHDIEPESEEESAPSQEWDEIEDYKGFEEELLKEYFSQEEIDNLEDIENALFEKAFEKSDSIYKKNCDVELNEEQRKVEYQNYIQELEKETEIFNEKLEEYIKNADIKISELEAEDKADKLEIQLIIDRIYEADRQIEVNNEELEFSKLAIEKDVLFNSKGRSELRESVLREETDFMPPAIPSVPLALKKDNFLVRIGKGIANTRFGKLVGRGIEWITNKVRGWQEEVTADDEIYETLMEEKEEIKEEEKAEKAKAKREKKEAKEADKEELDSAEEMMEEIQEKVGKDIKEIMNEQDNKEDLVGHDTRDQGFIDRWEKGKLRKSVGVNLTDGRRAWLGPNGEIDFESETNPFIGVTKKETKNGNGEKKSTQKGVVGEDDIPSMPDLEGSNPWEVSDDVKKATEEEGRKASQEEVEKIKPDAVITNDGDEIDIY